MHVPNGNKYTANLNHNSWLVGFVLAVLKSDLRASTHQAGILLLEPHPQPLLLLLLLLLLVLGLELRAYTLSHPNTPFYLTGFFEIGAHKLLAQTVSEL
jgi:hypothetical protein